MPYRTGAPLKRGPHGAGRLRQAQVGKVTRQATQTTGSVDTGTMLRKTDEFEVWTFFVLRLSGVGLSFLCFDPPPMALSVLVEVMLGCAAGLT